MSRSLALPLLLALLVAAPLATQTRASGDESNADAGTEFFDRVDVDVVNVEVFVTDRKGNPIRGLTRDEFRLFEDGEEQTITNFYAADDVRAGGPETNSETGSERSSETVGTLPRDPDVVGDVAETTAPRPPTVVPDPAQQLHLVLFVDHRNLRARSRNRVLKSLRDELLSDLRLGDRVTLVSYDGSVEVETLPTADPAAIDTGLERLMDRAPTGQLASMEQASLLRQLTGAGDADEMAFMLPSIRNYAQQRFDELRSTIEAMSEFVAVLSGLEGRKAIVYVSDGLSLHPGEVLFRAYAQRTGGPGGPGINVESESRQYNATPLFEALGQQANAGRVTFYTILASGPSSAALSPAEAPAFVDLDDTVNLGRAWDQSLETLEVANRRGSMEILAVSTGGKSTTSTSAFGKAIGEIQQDLRSFYSLGYATDDAESGDDRRKDRKLRVEVSNPKWVVRHRETYRVRGNDERLASITRTALMLQSGSNALGVVVEVGAPEKLRRKQWTVPMLVKFPLSRVTLLPGDDAYRGKASIYFASQDADGHQSPVQKVPAPIQVPTDQLELAGGQVAGYRLALAMSQGEHIVAVTVHDELADVASSYLLLYDPSSPPRPGP